MRKTNIIILSSLNKGKIEEYRALFKEFPEYQFKSIREVVFNPTALSKVESGQTYDENAFLKCQYGYYASKYPTFSDDSGLEVDALSGRPGVLSDRFAEAQDNQSQDEANIRKLLNELKGQSGEMRRARFICKIVFMVEGVVIRSSGILEGSILESSSGSKGFGYDPVFLPKGSDRSLAMMTLEEKNQISHRAQAFHNLIAEIKNQKTALVHP